MHLNNIHNGLKEPHLSAGKLRLGLQMITSVANILTDSLLLWRFYHIWGRTKLCVMIFPCIVAAMANIYGCVQMGVGGADSAFKIRLPLVYFSICALVSNIILTSLIAGRTFYIGYQVGKHLPFRATVPMLYRTVLSATLESGLIYPIALIIFSACALTNVWAHTKSAHPYSSGQWTWSLVAATMWDSLTTIMGIASTLIIVRVSLGIAINDEKSFKETIIRDYKATYGQPSTHSVMDICPQDSEDTESHWEH
ncbi:hypothetical protein PM082_018487 [Marasmius tenuissimus]|nr:hypothetical protein PM082_018487 [Marasmius tenuissimus]